MYSLSLWHCSSHKCGSLNTSIYGIVYQLLLMQPKLNLFMRGLHGVLLDF